MQLPLSELAAKLDLVWCGETDPLIEGVAGFLEAGPTQISFADDPKYLRRLQESRAGAIIVADDVDLDRPCLRSTDPRATFAAVLELFGPSLDDIFPAGIHPTASVADTATLEADVALGPGCVIGPGARIGRGSRLGAHVVIEKDVTIGSECLLYHQVVVRERCRLGDSVVLHPGVVIGTDGFGYHPGPDGLIKIPQIGVVVIENDVEIGANSCIDRATTGETRIGAGTKIDNQVQVGHNVEIGRHCAVSAQCGVSGSCRLGDGVTMGGQVGVADHLELGAGAKVAAKSGLTRDVPPGTSVFGYPAVEFRRGFRLVAHYQRLPELVKRLEALEARFSPQGCDLDAEEESEP